MMRNLVFFVIFVPMLASCKSYAGISAEEIAHLPERERMTIYDGDDILEEIVRWEGSVPPPEFVSRLIIACGTSDDVLQGKVVRYIMSLLSADEPRRRSERDNYAAAIYARYPTGMPDRLVEYLSMDIDGLSETRQRLGISDCYRQSYEHITAFDVAHLGTPILSGDTKLIHMELDKWKGTCTPDELAHRIVVCSMTRRSVLQRIIRTFVFDRVLSRVNQDAHKYAEALYRYYPSRVPQWLRQELSFAQSIQPVATR